MVEKEAYNRQCGDGARKVKGGGAVVVGLVDSTVRVGEKSLEEAYLVPLGGKLISLLTLSFSPSLPLPLLSPSPRWHPSAETSTYFAQMKLVVKKS